MSIIDAFNRSIVHSLDNYCRNDETIHVLEEVANLVLPHDIRE